MSSGVLFGVITMLTWGLWITFANYASESIDPVTAAVISYGTATILTIGYGIASDASLTITPRGGAFAVVAGVFAAVGLVATYIGLSIGSTATVATIGALYFVVAAAIGMTVLGDPFSISKAAGVVLAIVAIVLITY